MSITSGMDVAEVEDLGRFLQQRSERLRRIVQEVNRAVYSVPWEGGVALQFGQQHWPAHRARLQAAADQLHGLAQSALNNAAEQRAVSGNAGGEGPSAIQRTSAAGEVRSRDFWGSMDHISRHAPGVKTIRDLGESLKGFGWDAPAATFAGDHDLASKIIVQSTGKALDGAVDVLTFPVKGTFGVALSVAEGSEIGWASGDVLIGTSGADTFDVLSPSHWIDKAFGYE